MRGPHEDFTRTDRWHSKQPHVQAGRMFRVTWGGAPHAMHAPVAHPGTTHCSLHPYLSQHFLPGGGRDCQVRREGVCGAAFEWMLDASDHGAVAAGTSHPHPAQSSPAAAA